MHNFISVLFLVFSYNESFTLYNKAWADKCMANGLGVHYQALYLLSGSLYTVHKMLSI